MSESPPPSSIARLRGKGGRYHHGNLRGALIVAAAGILEAEGEAGLTLRALAERAGVSRAAPYRHFADKEALLAALAGEGFRVLDRDLERAAADAADAPARVLAMARAYVAFARRHHRMFRLMFAATGDATGDATANGLLHRRLREALAGLPAGDIATAAVAAWSLIHGLAVLDIDGRLAPAGADWDVDGVVGHLIDGLT